MNVQGISRVAVLGLAAALVLGGEVWAQEVDSDRPRLIFSVDAYRGELVVDSIDIAHLERVRVFRVVVGSPHFAVGGDRSVDFGFHGPTRWGVITPRMDGATVTLQLPAAARSFQLRYGGRLVWELRAGRASAHCDPVSEIVRPDGAVEWVFTPERGRLSCGEQRRAPVRPA